MNKWTEQQLNSMAEAYFEGTLSEQEEAELRAQLALSPITSDTIGEAKALMGFFATMRKQSLQATKPRLVWRKAKIISAAACIALIAIGAWHYSTLDRSDCIMYAQGTTITSEEKVMAMMNRQMEEMKKPSEGIETIVHSQLSDFGKLMSDKQQQ